MTIAYIADFNQVFELAPVGDFFREMLAQSIWIVPGTLDLEG